MKFKRVTMTLVSASVVALSGLVVLPSAAFASSPKSLWVNAEGTVSAGTTTGTSCREPGFTTIQSAIAAAPVNATIHVCSGTYTEQLQITSPLSIVNACPSVLVELPASPMLSSTSCDTAPVTPGQNPVQPNQDEIAICTTGAVSIKGITIQAQWTSGSCADSLFGIFVAGGANLKMTASEMDGASDVPLNGCQHGVGIQVGRSVTAQVGHVMLKSVKVVDYQKNGITIDGIGSTANIVGATVTGSGDTPYIAQNGIQVGRGAKASISHSTISGNECHAVCGPDGLVDNQATGVLFFGPASGSSVTSSSIDGNDNGIYAGAVTPNASTVSITHNIFGNVALGADRYEAMTIDGASATVSHNTVAGGAVGLQLLQYGGQPFASVVVARSDTFNGLTEAAAQVDSDAVGAGGGDLAGSLSISKSKLSGNPGSVTGSVLDNSPPDAAYTVTLKKDF